MASLAFRILRGNTNSEKKTESPNSPGGIIAACFELARNIFAFLERVPTRVTLETQRTNRNTARPRLGRCFASSKQNKRSKSAATQDVLFCDEKQTEPTSTVLFRTADKQAQKILLPHVERKNIYRKLAFWHENKSPRHSQRL